MSQYDQYKREWANMINISENEFIWSIYARMSQYDQYMREWANMINISENEPIWSI